MSEDSRVWDLLCRLEGDSWVSPNPNLRLLEAEFRALIIEAEALVITIE